MPYPHENDEKKPLSEWVKDWDVTLPEGVFQIYYPDSNPVSEWEAKLICHTRLGDAFPIPPDSTDAEVEVELVIRAKVKVTAPIRLGVKEEYSYPPDRMWDNERMAKDMLFASLNPSIPSDNKSYPDYWDGVGNMQGLIRKIELDPK